jgi:hypothetical protein
MKIQILKVIVAIQQTSNTKFNTKSSILELLGWKLGGDPLTAKNNRYENPKTQSYRCNPTDEQHQVQNKKFNTGIAALENRRRLRCCG